MKIESKISDLGKTNYILHRQMTEKMSLEVGVKKWSKIGKVHFLKCTFLLQMHFATKKKLVHMKIKNKISYLGKIISILHRQMTEQLSFEILLKKKSQKLEKVHF